MDSEALLGCFARLLPRELRERVFEPALADLHFDERSHRRGRWRRVASRLILVAECVRLVASRLVWRRRRPTRLSLAFLLALALVALAIQRAQYANQRITHPDAARTRS